MVNFISAFSRLVVTVEKGSTSMPNNIILRILFVNPKLMVSMFAANSFKIISTIITKQTNKKDLQEP